MLVVDDEPASGRCSADFLARRGLAVREAADGLAMRAALAAEPADVVVLDVTMPGESGLDLLADLRARGDDVPVVLLTACDGLDDRLAGLGRGADDYVTKPFEPRELLARIRAVLRRSPPRPRRPAAQPAAETRTVRLGRCILEPASGRLRLARGTGPRSCSPPWNSTSCGSCCATRACRCRATGWKSWPTVSRAARAGVPSTPASTVCAKSWSPIPPTRECSARCVGEGYLLVPGPGEGAMVTTR